MATNNDYHIITKSDPSDLATEVVSNLREGYILIGGVSVTYNSKEEKYLYAQAMLKKGDAEPLRIFS